jgi:NAD(P)H-hydrate epimerase
MSELPRWLDPLYTAGQMRAVDSWAIEQAGIPGLELMELAGTALARAALEPAPEGPIVIVCGKGNNGGDGLVAARQLREQRDRLGDKQVDVVVLGSPDELTPDARANLERLPGDVHHTLDTELIGRAGVIVDAMLGTGAGGAPRGDIALAVTAIRSRAAAARVIAVDIPTGVDADTGEIAGEAVEADLTIALHSAKLGHFVGPGAFACGEVRVADIAIPPEAEAAAAVTPGAGTIGPSVLHGIPSRDDLSDKFASGVLAVAGGSTGLTGAPCMAAMAAQRTGAGYVTAFVPRSLNLVFESRLLEVMTLPLPDDDGSLRVDGVEALVDRARRVDACVLGPGIGRADGAVSFVRSAVQRIGCPLLVDADGLWAFNGDLETLRRDAPTVITPHTAELARLLGRATEEVAAHRLASAREAAQAAEAVVVLKGSDTIVVQPDGPVAINSLRAPALATAGTGDVLSGVIGALLAKGLSPFTAASAGVYAHALAGREAAERRGADQVIATDVISSLASVLG